MLKITKKSIWLKILVAIMALSLGKTAVAADLNYASRDKSVEILAQDLIKLNVDIKNKLRLKIKEDKNISALPYFDCYLGISLITNQPQTYEIRDDLLNIYSDYLSFL